MESHARSIVKSLSWRVIAFATTMITVYIYSKDVKAALVVGVGANSIKMFLYYFHERLWTKIKFGMIKGPEYQI